jgi:hypothetical protein
MVMTIEPNTKQWLLIMKETLNKEAFVEMSVTMWAIWYAQQR